MDSLLITLMLLSGSPDAITQGDEIHWAHRSTWHWDESTGRPSLRLQIDLPPEIEAVRYTLSGTLVTSSKRLEIDIKSRAQETSFEVVSGAKTETRTLRTIVSSDSTSLLIHPGCKEHGLVLRRTTGLPIADGPLYAALYCRASEGLDLEAHVSRSDDGQWTDFPGAILAMEIPETETRPTTKTLGELTLKKGPISQTISLVELAGFRKSGRNEARPVRFDVTVRPGFSAYSEPSFSQSLFSLTGELSTTFTPPQGRWDARFDGELTFFTWSSSDDFDQRELPRFYELDLKAGYRLSAASKWFQWFLLPGWSGAGMAASDYGYGFTMGPSVGIANRFRTEKTFREVETQFQITCYGLDSLSFSFQGSYELNRRTPNAVLPLILSTRIGLTQIEPASVFRAEIGLGTRL